MVIVVYLSSKMIPRTAAPLDSHVNFPLLQTKILTSWVIAIYTWEQNTISMYFFLRLFLTMFWLLQSIEIDIQTRIYWGLTTSSFWASMYVNNKTELSKFCHFLTTCISKMPQPNLNNKKGFQKRFLIESKKKDWFWVKEIF